MTAHADMLNAVVLQFQQDIRDHPADPAPKLIFADWLDEHGLPRLAFAYRWAAGRKRHPLVSPKGRVVRWTVEPRRPRKPTPHALPVLVWLALRPHTRAGNGGRYHSFDLAFQALAMALDRLKGALAC